MSPYELGASLLSKCTVRATFGVLGISVGEGALVSLTRSLFLFLGHGLPSP